MLDDEGIDRTEPQMREIMVGVFKAIEALDFLGPACRSDRPDVHHHHGELRE